MPSNDFKYLDSPIERIQELNGGATLHSFQNADDGIAAGVEVEARKQIVRDLTAGANFSYMYTNVKLAENGAYTNKSRALQGASPILLNADIIYNPKFRRSSALEMSLTYNLQGKRIHAVGVSGLGDIYQKAVHTLNFNAAYKFRNNLKLGLSFKDMLNSRMVFIQEIPMKGITMEVESYRKGPAMEIKLSYTLKSKR